MSSTKNVNNAPMHERKRADEVLAEKILMDIADYVCDFDSPSKEALDTAAYCLFDSIGCALLALEFPHCKNHLGPIVAGTIVPNGARVWGTHFELDPVKAAWDLGCMIRWLDFNDTWLAAEWGHPSDNLGAIMALADFQSRTARAVGKQPIIMAEVLSYMIKAHEIQGILALENSFNRVGLDHVLLVRIASTAVATHMLGGNKEQIVAALSHAFADGGALRTYRHAPNAMSRKSWAAGDATSRAVRLAMLTMKGEVGMPSILSTPTWGFNDVCFSGNSLQIKQAYGCYVMENILFKISYPAEFHAQTAVECALNLYPQIKHRLDDITKITIFTHESALRIICKNGKLNNPADRDHCLQYMVAVALAEGNLIAEFYEDSFHETHPEIDELRNKMQIIEEPRYSEEYLEPAKRSIANAMEITFIDGTKTEKIEIEYPVGHRRRREEGIPLLMQKFERNVATCMPSVRCEQVIELASDPSRLTKMTADDFMTIFLP